MTPNFYYELINNLNYAVICINKNFNVELANQQVCELFGYKKDELINAPINSILDGFKENLLQRINIFDKPGIKDFPNFIFESEAVCSSGLKLEVELSISKWQYEQGTYISVIIRDISQHHREQEALTKAQDFIESKLENENRRLLEEEKEFIKMQEELRLAREIQQHLLPDSPPTIDGFDIAAINIPAKEVGGDYYDFDLNEEKLFFCLGDVSGKGMPASLLVANLQASLHSQLKNSLTPKEIIQNSNQLIYQNTDPTKFITFFYGLLDVTNGQITYCNAGHDQPILLTSKSKLINLQTGGIPLGVLPEFEYENTNVNITEGEILILYSDGITEAWNENQEEFGLERLINKLQTSKDLNAIDIIKSVINEIQSFIGEVPQMDDMTMMIIKNNK
jgi:sigma-B regulation protein RsbU (phosphoserine phosphatase)